MSLPCMNMIKNITLKKVALASTLALLTFAITPLSAVTNADDSNEILDIMLPILASLNRQCTSPQALNIISAVDDGNFDIETNVTPNIAFGPDNAIDGDPSELSRWSSLSSDITFELDSNSTVTDLSASWFRSEQRTSSFSVESSLDNQTWLPVLTNATSTVTASAGVFQSHDLTDSGARYIRIIGAGNSQNAFNSLTEVVVNGCVGLFSTSSSSTSSSSTSSSSTSSSSTSSSSTSSSSTSSSSTSSSSTSSGTGTPTSTSPSTAFTTSTGVDPYSASRDSVFNLSPNAQPWNNFNLSVWGLDSPALRNTSAQSGSSDFERGVRIDDFEFIALADDATGVSNSNITSATNLFLGTSSTVESSAPYFFTGSDGGMVFKSPVDGGRTSSGARFPRSELREYVRAGVRNRSNDNSISTSGTNENNWVLGYQPDNLILDDNGTGNRGIENVGGRNGVLTATLRVNKVTETGRNDDIGATIIGQIHAESDEPLRLYYRKLPQNTLGSIYFIHEINNGSDVDEFIIVGSRSDNASNPVGGVALDELFSYEIIAEGSTIEVVVRRGDFDGVEIGRTTIDMSNASGGLNSGYDLRNQWMYFKAGVYTQNNVALEDDDGEEDVPGAATTGFGPDGTEADYDQATFYRLSVSHDINDCSSCSD